MPHPFSFDKTTSIENWQKYRGFTVLPEMKLTDLKFKAKWVAALRSGEYKQAFGTLRSLDKDTKSYSYCCLGVGCNIRSYRKGWEEAPKAYPEEETKYAWRGSASSDVNLSWLPNQVVKVSYSTFWSVGHFLADVNDSNKFTLKQVGDWIEKNL